MQAKQLSLSQKNEALDLFVKEGWLAETPNRRGYYSLGVHLPSQTSSANEKLNGQGSMTISLCTRSGSIACCSESLPVQSAYDSRDVTHCLNTFIVDIHLTFCTKKEKSLNPQIAMTPSLLFKASPMLMLQVRTFLELHEMLLNLPIPAETRINWETFL